MCLNVCNVHLKHFPKNEQLWCLCAQANITLKLFDNAKENLEKAMEIAPDFALARDTYGDFLLLQGRPDMALKEYQQALQLNADIPRIEEKIERAKALQNKFRHLQKATDNKQGKTLQRHMSFENEIKLAQEHKESERNEEAEDIYRSILKKDPNHLEAARLLAAIAVEHERYSDAEILLKRVVRNAPDYALAWKELVDAQREQEKYDEATTSAQELLKITPDAAPSHMVYASIIGLAGRHEDAIEVYKKAIALSPKMAAALCSMAHHLKTIGKQKEAIAAYRQSVAIKPEHAESYWSLANLKTFQFTDEEIDVMQGLLLNKELPDESRVYIYNALGLDYESRKDYQKAFDNMSSCNQLRRQSESYDPVETETFHETIITLFNEEFFQQEAAKPSDITPIFIVGLPRSGSTLIEQILASHTQVEGTHELSDLSRAMQSVRRGSRSKKSFPEVLEHFALEQWTSLGQNYLNSTKRYRTGKLFFIDKNPNNFTFVGALKLALPHAKIINARRHPLDSCYGSFKQLFASGQPFTYDLSELGEYYMQYQKLMDYWHDVLPNFVLDIHYEKVVNDLDTEVRQILDFCDLPFEENCLRFHETERAVKTASSEQVRQPLYSSSVNLWRNYENNLDDLIETLKPLLIKLPKSERPISLQKID